MTHPILTPCRDWLDLCDRVAMLGPLDNPDCELGFDMTSGGFDQDAEDISHPCGTAACLAGTLAACNHERSDIDLDESIADFLGCGYSEAYALVFPCRFDCPDAHEATPSQGIRALQILMLSGKSDWPRAMREGAGLDSLKHREWGLGS